MSYNWGKKQIPNHIEIYCYPPRWHNLRSYQSWFNNWGIHVTNYIWGSYVRNYNIRINYLLGWNRKTKWVGGQTEIFDTIEIILIANARTSVDNCGRGVMFGEATRTWLEGNT
jgi:hypothetical protein